MIVRPLGPADLAEWRRIRAEGLRAFPRAFLTTLAEELARPDAAVRDALETRLILGLFEGARLIGTAGLDPVLPVAAVAHRAELKAVYLSSDHHGSGAADRLMEGVVARALRDGRRQIELFVAADNARAISFYERHGFARYGRLPRAARIDGAWVDDLFYLRQLDG
ncbi:GNAT family N-acetyltransferase [Limimaricola pyoseonensis]|uniref:Acetyltransferase (GNAT) family protein n=1 Tax=Limimaricola pyoseonensis TaxID=521013 RepID=A0A1G7IGD9_9RHOB|nr:GNAT family N-acetyltransferase [Limimaricola pyoseonensis]SDF11379.1 Acetyltransferase (GNAT) family protein [Limimaricola pyoseonensis]